MSQNFMKPQERQRFPIFESIASAAASIGVTESMVKAAKRKGCSAFITGSRVDSNVLIPFLFDMIQKGSDLPEGFSSWKEVLESEKAKREAIKRQQDEGSTMLTAEAIAQAAAAMSLVFAELERRARELPPALAGLPAVEIFKRMEADTEAIRKTLKAKFQEVGK